MRKEVIAIFDIGKTNKKVLLFDEKLNLVYQDEKKFPEVNDDEGFLCDDIERFETWLTDTLHALTNEYQIRAINFSTYGATLMYLDEKGKRLTPAYNYLKPMPEGVLGGFYERYGGVEEFSRQTASPALDMLNSGLQIVWLKKKKTDTYKKVKSILHFPQYVSYFLTGKVTSEYTSIGCHTAMWDFDHNTYHRWLADEGIQLPEPVSNDITYDVTINGQTIPVGIGIHDSSASLAPYIKGSKESFILISTGTWCISMNPFNEEPLTTGQLKKDTLCYMSVQQKQVKSSRLFMGHIHEVNAKRLADHFGVPEDQFKKVKAEEKLIGQILSKSKGVFFKNGVPADYTDTSVDLNQFASYDEAYHQLMIDLTSLGMDSLKLITPQKDDAKAVYISGGFARNEIYVRLLATWLPGKKVYTSEVDNASALGAAVVVLGKAFGGAVPEMDLGLKEYKPFRL